MDKLNSRVPKVVIPIEIHNHLVHRFGAFYTTEDMVLWLLEQEFSRMTEKYPLRRRVRRIPVPITEGEPI